MALNTEAYVLAKNYTAKSLAGAGALKGKDGDSAYQIALNNGFEGTEQEWLDSLKADESSVEVIVQEEVTKQIETQLQDTIQESVDKAIEDALSGSDESNSDLNDEIDSWFQ